MQLIDDSRISLFNSGKRMAVLVLFLLIFILFNLFLYLIIDLYFEEKEKINLQKNINLIETILSEKKKQLLNYTKLLARFPDLENITEKTLLTRRLYNLHSSLNIRGIQVWDKELNLLFETGTGFYGGNTKLNNSVLEVLKDGYSVSFFNQNEHLDLQITSFSPVYDEYSIRSSSYVSMTEVIKKDYINKIAYNIDGVLKFYNINELNNNSFEPKMIYKEKIDDRIYYVSYIPVRDFYNNILGCYTVLIPRQNSSEIIKSIFILSLCFFSLLFSIIYYRKLIVSPFVFLYSRGE